jgi:hypothetical protein
MHVSFAPLFLRSLRWIAPLALVGLTVASAEAGWPRYRVNAAYSLPSAPSVGHPTIAPVQVQPVYPVNPGVYVPAQSYPTLPTTNFQQPLSPPQIHVPHITNYQPTFNPVGAQPLYNPASHASYYQPAMPLPIQPYTPAVQPYGGYYQPTRPSSFYAPQPSYHYAQPIYGKY